MSSIPSYPEKLEIAPLSRPPTATVHVPGSKSITNRALVLAALSGNSGYDCELRGALQSEDTEVMCSALRSLGFRVGTDWLVTVVRVGHEEGNDFIPASRAE